MQKKKLHSYQCSHHNEPQPYQCTLEHVKIFEDGKVDKEKYCDRNYKYPQWNDVHRNFVQSCNYLPIFAQNFDNSDKI